MDYSKLKGQEVSNPSADSKLRLRNWAFQLSIYSFQPTFGKRIEWKYINSLSEYY